MACWTTLSVFSNIQIENWCEDTQKEYKYLYIYLGLGIAAVMFSGIRAAVLIASGVRQGRTLHKKVIKAIIYASINKFFNRVPIGRILNRLSKDLRDID
jgi:ATP-binding cassette subfamily C (CFTR/MRP) protein 1